MQSVFSDEIWIKLKKQLSRSKFRSNFKLRAKETAYAKEKGLSVLKLHANEIVSRRLAPAFPKNDGKQTPMKGHPVFIAQHATATCCRSCLKKWHGIPKDKALTSEEQEYVVFIIMKWIEEQLISQ